MLSPEDNEAICRVGPDTPMGRAARRYWLPALLSAELPEAGGDPVPVKLLGEDLVAFRDETGRVGLLGEYCRHRGASLTLGRVEGCGLRCIYHGWSFAADGEVLETPNVADSAFKTRFRAKSYPTQEAGGLVWAYMGPADKVPPLPSWAWMDLPEPNRLTCVHVIPCNYVQVLEGLVDTTHLGILHANGLNAATTATLQFAENTRSMRNDLMPTLEAEDTEYGFRYVALRTLEDEGGLYQQARVTAFQPPCFVLNPNGDVITICVPASDEETHFYHVFWDETRTLGEEPLRREHQEFVGMTPEALDAYGISRRGALSPARPSRLNRYGQDRAAMKSGNFSGLPGLIQEDVAVSVASGPLRDRSQEMLSVADIAVQRLQRTLLTCVRRTEAGRDPIGVSPDYAAVVGYQRRLAMTDKWRTPPVSQPSAELVEPG